jgi:transcriptional regulator of acetoin/glycerol metabolism
MGAPPTPVEGVDGTRALGITREGLYKKMKRLNME